jgi:hypothetical protein
LGIISLVLLSSTTTFAQKDISQLLQSNVEDSKLLIDAYLTPMFKGFGTGLNSGWNNTAKTKKLGRFELRISASGAFVPAAYKSFDITKIGLSSNIRPSNPNAVIAPTVAGGKDMVAPQIDIYSGSQLIASNYTLPSGADVPVVPAPQIQATVGLPKGFDVTLRLMPKIKLGDVGSVYMIGGGVKVDLMRCISGATKAELLPFKLALAAGYTQFQYSLPLDVQAPGTNFTNQSLEGKISGFNLETIISKKLLMFTPFVSVGYNSSRTKVDLKGDYPVQTGPGAYTTFSDPISINKRYVSGLRANMGFQLNLLLLRLYGSYSIAEYNSVNAGIGFGIGK